MMKKGQHSKKYFTTRAYVLSLLSEELGISEATVSKYISECSLHAPFDEEMIQTLRNHYNYIREHEHENRSNAISNAIKGENNPFYGKHHSAKAKKKLSDKRKGRVAWNKGKRGVPHTEEWKKEQSLRMIEAHKTDAWDTHYAGMIGKPSMALGHRWSLSEEVRMKHANITQKAWEEGRLQGGKKRYFFAKKPSKYCPNECNYTFDSSWELMYFLSFCSISPTGFPIIPNNVIRNTTLSYEYYYNNEKHLYFPDFLVDDKPVEIKGEHLLDQNPFDHNKDGLFKAKLQCMLDHNVEIIKDISFYKELVEMKFCPRFWELFSFDIPFPETDDIYKCHVKGHLSPMEAWNDTVIRTKMAFNRLVYGNVGEYHKYATPTPKDILQAMSITKAAPKVSAFRASTTIRLLQKYAPSAKRIVDPFAGFGGRMEGCRKLGLQYFGFDIEIKNNLPIVQRDVLSDYPKEKYDCLITCPPYSDKEEWLNEMPEIRSCDEWIDVCLEKFDCNTYIFVVDEAIKYSRFIIDEASERNGLIGKGKSEKVVVIHKWHV